jgi:hypothetical protein
MANKFEIVENMDFYFQHGDIVRGLGRYNGELVYFSISEYGIGLDEDEYTPEMHDVIQNYVPPEDADQDLVFSNKYYAIHYFGPDSRIKFHVVRHHIYKIYRAPAEILEQIKMFATGFYDDDNIHHRYDSQSGADILDKFRKIPGKYADIVFYKWYDYFSQIDLERLECLGKFSVGPDHEIYLLE